MIETFSIGLPHGITLSCRASGPRQAPLLIFLHGFPQAAFVWDALLEHFGERYRCVAPNLRGYEQSTAPSEVEAYRAKHLVTDIVALAKQLSGNPIEALVAHDWGGAVAWNLAAQFPQVLKRLIIFNSPHPATFLREMQHNPQQQANSAYMNFLCRPDAETLLSENDFARIWPFFSQWGSEGARQGELSWLTESVKDQYRAVWRAGLSGALNYYRASPVRPPTASDTSIMKLTFPAEMVTVHVPTWVIWGENDVALPPTLLDGLSDYVRLLKVTRVPGASHWIVHEQPELVEREIERALSSS